MGVDARGRPPGGRERADDVRRVPRSPAPTRRSSRPWWMWGAEMGANEHGVAIGNEAVFTKQPTSLEPGLLGMDLFRLALERATTADEAVEVMVALLEEHGQSVARAASSTQFTYHNSFLVADADSAVVLETAGRHWATEQVRGAARSISNGLTIPDFAEQHADRLRGRSPPATPARLTSTGPRRRGGREAMRILRDNGTGRGPRWSPLTGSMVGPNMHAGGWLAPARPSRRGSATSARDALVDRLGRPGVRAVRALRVDEPLDEAGPTDRRRRQHRDDRSLWWRHERLHRRALRDWTCSEALVVRPRPARAVLGRRPAADGAGPWRPGSRRASAGGQPSSGSPSATPGRGGRGARGRRTTRRRTGRGRHRWPRDQHRRRRRGAGLRARGRPPDRRAGRSVVVVEARDRVGGRTEAGQLADGQWIELGGQWVGPRRTACTS